MVDMEESKITDVEERKNLGVFKKTRQYIRAKVTNKCNRIDQVISNYDIEDVEEELEYVDKMSTELADIDSKIGVIIFSNGDQQDVDSEMHKVEDYETRLRNLKRALKARFVELSPQGLDSAGVISTGAANHTRSWPGAADNSLIGGSGGLSRMRMPKVPFPTFGKIEGENFTIFIDQFQDIYDKYNLTETEGYYCLEKQLSNDPLLLIQGLTGNNRTYSAAKKLLESAFARPTQQKFENIRKLANLKFESDEPYKFVSDMNKIISSFNDLKIDIQSVMQYFFWFSLPKNYQTEMLHVTNSVNPTLDQMKAHIFDVIDRVKHSNEISQSVEHHASLAANVQIPVKNKDSSKQFNSSKTNSDQFKPCVLCVNDKKKADHPIYKCTVYSSAKMKVEKLKNLKLCYRCAGPKHFAKDCKFNFTRNCKYCDRKHFSYLCSGQQSENKASNTSQSYSVDVDTFSAKTISGNILPSFSAKLKNQETIRIMKDSGAGTSFISKDLAEKHNLPIIKKKKFSNNQRV